ncbi:1-deoxy-D-xylulose-5-phosphate synthase [Helicobacter aurati]|nr:1-deoxy-D-xylulose-5-phosphate synthase [Helicobacter aurati]
MQLQFANIESLEVIAQAIRERILEVVSKNGGHLSSTLGAVELIVGMHTVYDCTKHPFIYDVSHQAYAHKLLTGRYEQFSSLRQFGGISGFIAPNESALDYFIAGHSSTSLSLAVGVAKARKLNKHSNNQSGVAKLTGKPIAMIGDGAMSAGLVYEALNELGDLKLPVVILLNDNEMSIAKPIGVISKILSKTIATPLYQSMRERIKKIVDKMPEGTAFIAKRFEESFKLITPGLLFEEFGIDYIGPINGNNLEEVISVLKSTENLNRPVLIHCQTIKGKGYQIAEGKYEKWHGVAPFDLHTGKALAANATESPTQVFSKTLLAMAKHHSHIVGVTAAMPSGTGLDKLIDEFPERFFDVAIAEQHAVTSMAAMAKEGFKPYIAIYSTFLQRAFDQIIHDVSIMNLPVVFCIDRAGIVGEDGETHQGLLDIAYLQSIPHIVLVAPRDNLSLEYALQWSVNANFPLGIRYPRGKFIAQDFYIIRDMESFANMQQHYSDSSNLHNHSKEQRRCMASQIIACAFFKKQKDYKTHLHHKKAQMILDNWENAFHTQHDNLIPDSLSHISVQDSLQTNSAQIHSNNKGTNDTINFPITHDTCKCPILFLGYGNGVGRAAATLESLYTEYGLQAHLMDLIFLKPLDSLSLVQCLQQYTHIFIFSDSYKINGVGARIMQFANELYTKNELCKIPKIISFEIDDIFVKHGKTERVEQSLGLDCVSLAQKVHSFIS